MASTQLCDTDALLEAKHAEYGLRRGVCHRTILRYRPGKGGGLPSARRLFLEGPVRLRQIQMRTSDLFCPHKPPGSKRHDLHQA